ncbi:MAG TPA: DegT/DnrJ/EryC1/StrS family aminotransferase [Pirellulales bacterium]|nr:DegT/DnrJ/EryC1/StrS family aminotransferase [Pirellulales bacterium]
MKPAASSANAAAATKISSVPLLDIQRQHAPLRAEIDAAMARVCDSGRFILGPDCEELEAKMADYCQAPHAVACASGSDALLLALMAGDVGPGDEVLLPSYTFFATAGAVWRLGARPVFVDIDPATFNIDPTDAAARVTERTKAIIPVHLFGQCADMTAIKALAERHGLLLVEDAAQAIGSEFGGRRAGSLGDVGCFSFYPTKNLGGIGDGGMLTTDDKQLADRLRLLRGHGMQPRYYHQAVGMNSRLDTLQAAVLNVKFPHLESWTAGRQANAARYTTLLAETGLSRTLGLPTAWARCRHVWNQYVVRIPGGQRDALREHLSRAGVGTEIYYPVPLHLQQCFTELGYAKGSLPESERAAAETIALPIFPELTAAEQNYVVERMAEFARPAGHPLPKPHLNTGNLASSGDMTARV